MSGGEYLFQFDDKDGGVVLKQVETEGVKALEVTIYDGDYPGTFRPVKGRTVLFHPRHARELAEVILSIIEVRPGETEARLSKAMTEALRHISNARGVLENARVTGDWSRLTSSFKDGQTMGAKKVLAALEAEGVWMIQNGDYRVPRVVIEEVIKQLEKEHEAYDEKAP